MPEDIHESMWNDIKQFIEDGHVAVTLEIFEEMILIDGGLGDFIASCKDAILFEVGADHWDWQTYIKHAQRMQTDYEPYISEFSGGTKKTIGLNDLSIIALAKTLAVPVLNMESKVVGASPNKRRIPNICEKEGILSVTINEFLRLENLRF